ncbi:MAG TPA: radical SAM protein [Syntrophobacteria bacterium]|nr:radical SAM protein [Syntrophobacteria bacterium]
MKRERPLVIPVFAPQEGCPHRCVYCDQGTITGVTRPNWSRASLRAHVEDFLTRSRRHPVEVAFYGGSFTLLPQTRQAFYLEALQGFLQQARVQSLRLSTRPDAISAQNLRFLHAMGMRTVELGVQSLNDRVLAASARGYTSVEVIQATALLRDYRFRVGFQLMPGLPGENRATFLETIDKSTAIGPDFVRLYPTVILSGTPLEDLYRRGSYHPLSLPEAVDWCKEALLRLSRNSIPVIRMGLQTGPSLERPGAIVAGPHHPAFGQLVKSALWYDRIFPVLAEASRRSSGPIIRVHPFDLADVRGHRNGNLSRWLTEMSLPRLKVISSPEIPPGEFRVTSR